ncbi:DNA helicase-2/ATP-dependent DNA helicase PcrA [Nitrosospira sp. Nsp5]|uniref:DNA 3'-5' helicase n=1 Tax=Nitrosospira multiformis TaxID=1231 RepID=A0ABY0T9I8_9PROT|nr:MULTISPECIES: UvrD-helicase domain-containing protein [Nitrosospira]PTR08083.1 DNA helicase-2/ATP-dependent DNA helicase PcrA [Nitrosospira sp. Nsp5]SDQ48599.1 DNA helicase-2 / ATP-dependent DNA helicase PcrA [Nitrosospira multiformis]
MSSLISELNPEQFEAVTLPHQSALVLAGAGSGKTRVLTTRIAYLIQSGQVSPHGILAVTFTNKAAKEMLIRIASMLPIDTRGMWVGTFHGLCNRMLRAHHQDAGLPQAFQILDSADQLAVIKRLLKVLDADDEKFPPRQVQWFINNAKEEGLRASQVEIYDDFARKMVEFYLFYEQQCNKEGVVDFAELLLRSYELLTRNEHLREHYRGRFDHILVDEFQDTNRLQYKWLKLLAGNRAAVFAVGDDDQSIYAFRGANTGNMKDFERDFHISKIIKLEQNYRSHGNILDAANTLIRNNSGRLGKNLWTSEGHGEPIRVYNAPTDFDEASFIVDEVKSLRAEGVVLSQIALLYRSNAQSRVLEHALFNASLAYRVYGGMRFFERQEIKHALAYLRLMANPEDDNALLRIINFPVRGIGMRSLEQLQDEAKRQGGSLWAAMQQKYGNDAAFIPNSGDQAPIRLESNQRLDKPRKGVEGFAVLIESMRQVCEKLPLPEAVEHMLEHSGLVAHYRAEREGADRLENLNELINAATGFVHEAEDDSLTAFLSHASLEAGEHQAGSGQDALQLMTVHSAKGLEFHSVFLSGLEEGLFPHDNSRNEAGGVEEERRLMYVALTRARRRLYLSFAQSRMLHGQTRYNIPSRFLHEIPDSLLKWLQPMQKATIRNEDWGRGRQGSGRVIQEPGVQARTSNIRDSTASQWRIGQNVMHAKFGAGVIVNCEGHGADARVEVRFGRIGTKWLLLEYAKLTPA